MSAILSFLKEEFSKTDGVGIMLGPEMTLEVIRALEENAWLKEQVRQREYIIEVSRQASLLTYEALEKKDARIKHLEGIIERTKNEANLYYGTGNLLDILNEV